MSICKDLKLNVGKSCFSFFIPVLHPTSMPSAEQGLWNLTIPDYFWFQRNLFVVHQKTVTITWRLNKILESPTYLQWFNLGFFDFTMVQNWYTFSRNHTLNFDFWSFPGLTIYLREIKLATPKCVSGMSIILRKRVKVQKTHSNKVLLYASSNFFMLFCHWNALHYFFPSVYDFLLLLYRFWAWWTVTFKQVKRSYSPLTFWYFFQNPLVLFLNQSSKPMNSLWSLTQSLGTKMSTTCSLRPHGLSPTRLLPPCDSPGKSTGVGCHFLLQGIFLTQGSNSGILHSRQTL